MLTHLIRQITIGKKEDLLWEGQIRYESIRIALHVLTTQFFFFCKFYVNILDYERTGI